MGSLPGWALRERASLRGAQQADGLSKMSGPAPRRGVAARAVVDPSQLADVASTLAAHLPLAYEPVALPCSMMKCGDVLHRRWGKRQVTKARGRPGSFRLGIMACPISSVQHAGSGIARRAYGAGLEDMDFAGRYRGVLVRATRCVQQRARLGRGRGRTACRQPHGLLGLDYHGVEHASVPQECCQEHSTITSWHARTGTVCSQRWGRCWCTGSTGRPLLDQMQLLLCWRHRMTSHLAGSLPLGALAQSSRARCRCQMAQCCLSLSRRPRSLGRRRRG